MKSSYQKINEIPYAKISGKSFHKNSKIGRGSDKHSSNVIDKENNVLFNKERGMFTYDPEIG